MRMIEDIEWIAQRHEEICDEKDRQQHAADNEQDDADDGDDDMSQSDDDEDADDACLELYRITDFYDVQAASNDSRQHREWTKLCDRFAQIENDVKFVRAQLYVMETCRVVSLLKLDKSCDLPIKCQNYLELWDGFEMRSKVWKRWTKKRGWGPSTHKKTKLHCATKSYKRKGNSGRNSFWNSAEYVPLISFDTRANGTTDWALDLRTKMSEPTTQQSFHIDHRDKLHKKYKDVYALVPDHEQGLQCAYDMGVALRRAKSSRDSGRWPTTPRQPSIIPKLDKSRVRPFLCRRNVSFNLNVDD